MIAGNNNAISLFSSDLKAMVDRITERSAVLVAEKKKTADELDEENSNLTPEQSVAFKSFPKFFQDALLSNDLNSINDAFAKMSKEESDEIMEKCQSTGLIRMLDEQEATSMLDEQDASSNLDADSAAPSDE